MDFFNNEIKRELEMIRHGIGSLSLPIIIVHPSGIEVIEQILIEYQ